MRKGNGVWRRLDGIEKAFLSALGLYVIFAVTGMATLRSLLMVITVVLGTIVLFRFARRAMRQAIWRLRNRLIAAYLFIAVVPIVLILTLVGFAGWAVLGQMAVYLVNTELRHHEDQLTRQAEALARIPVADPERALGRAGVILHNAFPDFQLLIRRGSEQLRYPENAEIAPPPAGWGDAHGLIVKKENGEEQLFAWAHHTVNGEEVTLLAPVTHDYLSGLVPGLGDVNFVPLMGRPRQSHIPEPKGAFDFKIRGYYPTPNVRRWESPDLHESPVLVVDTRISPVLATVFQNVDWAEFALGLFVAVAVLFLVVELLSLFAGVKLSRSITSAVHELYEGTRRIKEGDFSYRIPVKGSDQLAELGTSFNSMTANLGRLIVVAKEKERLESELAIAREVQNQLFPKDVPFTRTLELTGVCHPARMVSGDYYDFMSLSESSLAFAIGDVAGKGISAALLMATIQSTMRTQLNAIDGVRELVASGHLTFNRALPEAPRLSAAQLVSNLNRQLYATTAPEKYATFYFALYDDATHSLTYTNAGHLAPMLLRDGAITTLDSTGTVVGAFPKARYAEKTLEMQKGDMLVAYTDGIVEPENAYGEMYGEERLKELLLKHAHADSSEIIARTMEAVNQWTGSSELQDDMTMVVARRLSA
ncbi:MAG TPA: SpoIIE family protein phosphatase [Bryobacteraceae bacterium]|nr:SpoIIE family protein phosphatase [Bryobacteraceae bacterium]